MESSKAKSDFHLHFVQCSNCNNLRVACRTSIKKNFKKSETKVKLL